MVNEREETGGQTNEDLPYWLAFRLVPYIGPVRMVRLADHFGTLAVAWRAGSADLRRLLDERTVASLLETRSVVSPEAELERLDRLGIQAITLRDDEYPAMLAEIAAPPPVLYIKGTLTGEDSTAIAIVGTRKMSSYGREVATRIAAGLAAHGVTVVSGMARGVDSVAHNAALQQGGRTIAVLGSGLDVIYPAEHRQLAERIAGSGAVISDFPPGTAPDAQNFPARNRIIAGLSLGTVVVEAPARSGALITVDFALDQGREVFAVPGSVLSAASDGANHLLREGARAVRSAEDILEDLNLDQRLQDREIQESLPLTDDERRLLALLGREPVHMDELIVAANLSAGSGAAAITMLELKGLVRNAGSQHFVKN